MFIPKRFHDFRTQVLEYRAQQRQKAARRKANKAARRQRRINNLNRK